MLIRWGLVVGDNREKIEQDCPSLLFEEYLCMQVWRIEKFELTEVPEEKHGQFTSGDCYVVLYSYGDPQRHVVYMWQGAESTVDERGGCAVCAVQIDEQHCGGSAPQVPNTLFLLSFVLFLSSAAVLLDPNLWPVSCTAFFRNGIVCASVAASSYMYI